MTGIEQWDALQHAVRVDCQNLRSLLLVLWSVVGFAVAFPSHVQDREQMRLLLKQFGANMPPFPGYMTMMLNPARVPTAGRD